MLTFGEGQSDILDGSAFNITPSRIPGTTCLIQGESLV